LTFIHFIDRKVLKEYQHNALTAALRRNLLTNEDYKAKKNGRIWGIGTYYCMKWEIIHDYKVKKIQKLWCMGNISASRHDYMVKQI
jgi:hypothetical protein